MHSSSPRHDSRTHTDLVKHQLDIAYPRAYTSLINPFHCITTTIHAFSPPVSPRTTLNQSLTILVYIIVRAEASSSFHARQGATFVFPAVRSQFRMQIVLCKLRYVLSCLALPRVLLPQPPRVCVQDTAPRQRVCRQLSELLRSVRSAGVSSHGCVLRNFDTLCWGFGLTLCCFM